MDNSKLKSLVEEGKQAEAVKVVKEFYGVSLKEAGEYVDSIMQENEAEIKSKKRKKNILKVALIIIPTVLVGLIVIGTYKTFRHMDEESKMYDSWYKDVYGPQDYKEAYLKIANDPMLKAQEKSDLYMELRKEEISGTPFKETKYWKNYKLK
jgi:hypothetical protein